MGYIRASLVKPNCQYPCIPPTGNTICLSVVEWLIFSGVEVVVIAVFALLVCLLSALAQALKTS